MLSAPVGRGVYFMNKRHELFDMKRFVLTGPAQGRPRHRTLSAPTETQDGVTSREVEAELPIPRQRLGHGLHEKVWDDSAVELASSHRISPPPYVTEVTDPAGREGFGSPMGRAAGLVNHSQRRTD